MFVRMMMCVLLLFVSRSRASLKRGQAKYPQPSILLELQTTFVLERRSSEDDSRMCLRKNQLCIARDKVYPY
jgi:hypothetical protein